MNRFLVFGFGGLLLFGSLLVKGQNLDIKLEKDSFKIDEPIEVIFEINETYQSVEVPEFIELKLVSGPEKRTSINSNSGEVIVKKSLVYKLLPINSGKVKIKSPVYIIDGKKVKGKPKTIYIHSSLMTNAEREARDIKEFATKKKFVRGTTRFVISENKGYMETFNGVTWTFNRLLTQEEIDNLSAIKKD